jgi:FkbM family methyltransferase
VLNTNQKIMIARGLAAVVLGARRLVGLSHEVTTVRRGIRWSLNLKEGIDFAIYLLGGFEVQTLRRYRAYVHEGDVVLDVGANIGAHMLPLAQLVGFTGRVLAFEPTRYAYDKLMKNAALNPDLASRVTAHQAMLVSDSSSVLPDAIYSSWPLEGTADLHADHQGRLMSTDGAAIWTLDDFVTSRNLPKIDFIKLDVDGNEHDVLLGARQTLGRFRPALMIELAPYVYDLHPEKFDEVLKILWDNGYQISDAANGRRLPEDAEAIRGLIPSRGCINAVATCDRSAARGEH